MSYVGNNPSGRIDPFGLFEVVGVNQEFRVIYRDARGCYVFVNNRKVRHACVGNTQPDDPDGIPYQQGLQDIYDSLGLLLGLCDSCPGNSCCSPSECRSDAMDIMVRLMVAWQANYGHGGNQDSDANGGHPVGGHYCYDWGKIFDQAVSSAKSRCFSTSHKVIYGPKSAKPILDANGDPKIDPKTGNPIQFIPAHVIVEVTACGGNEIVSIDNGWLEGNWSGILHPGPWDPAENYEDWRVSDCSACDGDCYKCWGWPATNFPHLPPQANPRPPCK